MDNEQKTPLRLDSMNLDPITQFNFWLQDAENAKLPQPNAMTLATSNKQNKPSARIVLLRGVNEHGFAFFTNYESRKAEDLSDNPVAALVFCWLSLSRQIRIEGRVELLSTDDSDRYFANRPRGHQIEAHASAQSRVIEDRSCLDKNFKDIAETFEGQAVPRPLHWGGYRVIPETIEFWQEGENRLHDRLRYRRNDNAQWVIERLSP